MMMIAPMSSTMARPSKKARNEAGTLFPITEITPTANAISVATGMAQPRGALDPAIAR